MGYHSRAGARAEERTAAPASLTADTSYFGGPILTMEGDRPSYVGAVAVAGGPITFAGRLAQAERRKGPATRMVELAGKRFSRPA